MSKFTDDGARQIQVIWEQTRQKCSPAGSASIPQQGPQVGDELDDVSLHHLHHLRVFIALKSAANTPTIMIQGGVDDAASATLMVSFKSMTIPSVRFIGIVYVNDSMKDGRVAVVTAWMREAKRVGPTS